MFYYYNFLPGHKIYQIQEFYKEIVSVWCKADAKTSFSVTALFSADCVDFINRSPIAFAEQIRDLYNLFVPLSSSTKKKIRAAWDHNNNIEVLCTNKRKGSPVTFAKLKSFEPKKINETFIETLKTFNAYIYKNIPAAAEIIKEYGSLKVHFDDFKAYQTQINICPFCGLKNLESQYGDLRDAYDHFLPKSKYPFNSINFRNLAPICDVCNEKHKGKKDPIHYEKGAKKGKRRVVFYPYSKGKINISPMLMISKGFNFLAPRKGDFQFRYTCSGNDDQIENWVELFGASSQHSTLTLDMRRIWLEDVLVKEFMKVSRYAPSIVLDTSFIADSVTDLKKAPLVDFAFLKAAYFNVLKSRPDLMKVVNDAVSKRKKSK